MAGLLHKEVISTDKAPPPLPVFSQAIKCGGMICTLALPRAQALRNLSAVLEAAGSSLDNAVKVNVFLTTMENFAAMNKVYETFFKAPRPCRTCVAVKELPLHTDVEIECIAHQ
ncbi:MAG: hypothetical protein M1837_006944 [Sclerophora amabilis]|nr:MAG: hypothetical protein M1837_006944 [Sclerophora amabilis]